MRRRSRPREQGQAVVEMAVVLPIILLLLLGMAEFARLFSNFLTLQQAGREGARLAITGAADSAIINRIGTTGTSLDTTKMAVTITPGEPRASGSDVTISLAYPVPLITPIIAQIVGGTVTLQTQVVARME
jgi:Flp pilus assembly protein TadG